MTKAAPESEPATTTVAIDVFGEACRAAAALALKQRPNATGCKIVVEFPDGIGGTMKDVYGVPLVPSADDLRTAILAALGKLRPGEWMRGKTLGAEVDADHDSGHFKRVVAQLRQEELIESNRNLGYRLK